jgi:hypothetical protein
MIDSLISRESELISGLDIQGGGVSACGSSNIAPQGNIGEGYTISHG